MSLILLPISMGEAIDKLTILEIKYKLIQDSQKKEEVKRELDIIYPLLEPIKKNLEFYIKCLYNTNASIWNLCDMIRSKSLTTDDYSKLCIDIIKQNDDRFRVKNKINLLTNSSIKEQKNYKPKKVVICPHLGLGDMFTVVGAIRYYSIKYDEVITFSKSHNYSTVKNIFADDNSIKIEIADDARMYQLLDEVYSKGEYDILKMGCHVPNKVWYGHFYDDFYTDVSLTPDIRFSYFHISRNFEYEQKLYDDTVGKIGEYIFVHDKLERKFDLSNFVDLQDKYVYNPNYNYYPEGHKYHHIWNGMHDNITSYATIIENASEIYVIDSSFFCLLAHLNLKASKRVVLYSNWYEIKDYIRKEEQDKWTFIV